MYSRDRLINDDQWDDPNNEDLAHKQGIIGLAEKISKENHPDSP